WHLVVTGARAENNHIELIGLQAGACKGSRRSHMSEIRNPHVADRTFPDPGPFNDPRVACVEQSGEIVIREARGGEAFAPSDNGGVARITDSHPTRIPRRYA